MEEVQAKLCPNGKLVFDMQGIGEKATKIICCCHDIFGGK
jgi:hypothetical protein